MKSHIKKFSKSTISVILSLSIILSMIIVGIINVNAWSLGGGKIYFLAPSSWGSSVEILYDWDNNANACNSYDMTQIGSSRLFYANPNIDHSKQYAFVHGTGWGYSDQSIASRVTNTNHSNILNWDNKAFDNSSKYYLCIPSSSGNSGFGINFSTYDSKDSLKITQKAEAYYKNIGASSYSSGSTGGTVKVTGYYFTSDTAIDSSSTSSGSSESYNCAIGSVVTMKATAASGYVFDGWFATANGSENATSSSTTLSYTVDSTTAKTYYARFSKTEPTYNVTITAGTGGTINGSASTTMSVGATAQTLPTATPNYGYKFKRWVATSPAAIAANSTSASTATITATGSGGTVTANFEYDDSLNLYITGTFAVKDSSGNWTYVANEKNKWAPTDTSNNAFKLTYVANGIYQLNTRASLSELSGGESNSNGAKWMKVYDKDAGVKYAVRADADIGDADHKTTLVNTNSGTDESLKFNSSEPNTPVTLKFDATTLEFWYEVPPVYTVSVSAGTGGSVAGDSVKASTTTVATLPTATADFGYKFKNWTASGGGVSITNPTSANAATITATGTGGSVTANFEVDMSLDIYIVGRFRYRETDNSDWTYTGTNETKWNDNSTEIKLTATSTDFVYSLNTHASLAELSEYYVTGNIPYFHIRSGNNIFYPSDNTAMTTAGTTLGTTGTCNMYFDSDLVDKPVTIFFNTQTKKIWYETPPFYDVTVASVTGGSATANPARTKPGTQVTLSVDTLDDGYQFSSWSVKDASNNTVTVSNNTFTMPSSNVTVTPSFSEITHTVTVKRRFYSTNNTLISTSDVIQTLSGVGVSTAQQVNAADATIGDYSFDKFVLPTGVTIASGDLTTREAITVNATVDNPVIFVDYKETLYTITAQNDGHGTIQRNSANITTTQIGNVTAVQLTAVHSIGYTFKEWGVTAASSGGATTVDVDGTSYNISTTETKITANAASSFKFNGKATVKAYFQAVNRSISASFPANSGYTLDDTTGNKVSVSKSTGIYSETFTIDVLLADGYEVDTITGTGISGSLPTPTVNGRTYSYQYTIGDNNVVATVTLKAKTPTISSVQVKDRSLTFVTINSGGTAYTYFKQPTVAKATTESFSTLTYTTTKTNNAQIATESDKASNAEASLDSGTDVIPETEGGYATYNLTITATNARPGVDASATATWSCTVSVEFNDAQKVYLRLKNLLAVCLREDTQQNAYYENTAKIGEYNAAYDAAKTFICPSYSYNQSTGETYSPTNAMYPGYDATDTAAKAAYSAFKAKYDSMRVNAKTTTVYILTQYPNSADNPIIMKAWSKNDDTTSAGLNHFRMFHYADGTTNDGYHIVNSSYVNFEKVKMSYAGVFAKGSSSKYLYKVTYTGHVDFLVWCESNSNNNPDNEEKLADNVSTATQFQAYYLDVSNTSVGNPMNAPTLSTYVDFGHHKATTKKCLLIGDVKSEEYIKTLLELYPTSSLITSPEIDVTNTAFTIKGPIGSPNPETTDLKSHSFEAKKQGKYTVSYTTNYGTDENGHAIIRTEVATLWVAYNDIDVYVDMNDNVGIPVLNFKYFVNSSNEPVTAETTGATPTQLPCEMDLVTGSESIYKYTIHLDKLTTDYKMSFSTSSPIKVSYIAVEDYYVNTDGKHSSKPSVQELDSKAFQIGFDARTTGEVWFKADSTNLKTFNIISYGSVNKTFIAVADDGHQTLLSSAVSALHGTGINTDIDDKFYAQYASRYTLDNQSAPISYFNYVLKASAKEEISVGSDKYYFDKWLAVPAYNGFESGVDVDSNGYVTNSFSAAEDYSASPDLNFTSPVDYSDGRGDMVYIAKYKAAHTGDTTVRVEITYHFNDYDTSDGNYVYNPQKELVPATYTKTVKVNADFAAVQAAVDAIAHDNVPYVQSNYFTYSYINESAAVVTGEGQTSSDESKIVVNANLDEDERVYRIIVKQGDTTVDNETGCYQQTVTLGNHDVSNPVWKIKSGQTNNWEVLGKGNTNNQFVASFVSSGFDSDPTYGDCQILKLESDSNVDAHRTAVSSGTTQIVNNGNSEMLQHNFIIYDFCAQGELCGGGVLYATTLNGEYRYTSAENNLETDQQRKAFINRVLQNDYDTEYKAQSIENTGFRYLPFKNDGSAFRYSDLLQAYKTNFEGTNVNSPNYNGQKLRLYSFMVYKTGNTYTIVTSPGYAEVERYIVSGNTGG